MDLAPAAALVQSEAVTPIGLLLILPMASLVALAKVKLTQLPRSWKSSISRLRRSYPCGDILLGLSTELAGRSELVELTELRLRCEPAIAILGRTGCLGA